MTPFFIVLLRIKPRSQQARHPGHNRIRQQGREDNHVKQKCDSPGESSRYRRQRPTQQQDQWVNANYANNHLLPKWWLFSTGCLSADSPSDALAELDKPAVAAPEQGNGKDTTPDGFVRVSEVQAMIDKALADHQPADSLKDQDTGKLLPERLSDHFYDARTRRILPYNEKLAVLYKTGTQRYLPCAPNGGLYFIKKTFWQPHPVTGAVRKPLYWNPLFYLNNPESNILCDRYGSPVSKFTPELPLGNNYED